MRLIPFHRLTPLLLSVLLLLALSACVTKPQLPPPDPAMAATLSRDAELLVVQHNYPEAAAKFAEARSYQPDDPALALRAAELLEATERWEDAAELYRQELQRPALQAIYPQLHYRLGLLLVGHLNQPGKAENQLRKLSGEPLLVSDLQAVIEIAGKDATTALARLQQLLPQVQGQDLRGTIAYHIALAQDQLGDHDAVSRSLFDAINYTEHKGTVDDIKQFWEQTRDR